MGCGGRAVRTEQDELADYAVGIAALRRDVAVARQALLQRKARRRPVTDRARFAQRLGNEVRANAALLAGALDDLGLTSSDLPNISDLRDDAMAEWARRAAAIERSWSGDEARRAQALRIMEEALARRFAGRINAERQQALGIDRYIWRSRDDDRVRDLHAAHDDEVYFWDEPPEGGHPGEAYGCRCVAEPVLADEDEWRPVIDSRYGRAIDQEVLSNPLMGGLSGVASGS